MSDFDASEKEMSDPFAASSVGLDELPEGIQFGTLGSALPSFSELAAPGDFVPASGDELSVPKPDDGKVSIEPLLRQIESGLVFGLFYLSLYTTLTLPDICGAMEYPNIPAVGERYKKWYDKYMVLSRQRFVDFARADCGQPQMIITKDSICPTSDECYYLRCALLHQGQLQHPKNISRKFAFGLPTNPLPIIGCQMGDYYITDIRAFCGELIEAVRTWLAEVEHTPEFKINIAQFAGIHLNGIRGLIRGVPMIY